MLVFFIKCNIIYLGDVFMKKLGNKGFGLKEEIIYMAFLFGFVLLAGYYLKDLVRVLF